MFKVKKKVILFKNNSKNKVKKIVLKIVSLIKLQDAYNSFKPLKSESSNTSEIKIYNNFLEIITKLKSRVFLKTEILNIETELDPL